MMNTADRETDAIGPDWLVYVPPTFFASILGLSGLGLAWRRAEAAWGWTSLPGDIILLLGALVLVLLLPVYGAKFFIHRDAVMADVAHPIKGPFLGGMPLAILLQVPALEPIWHSGAIAIWFVGAAASFGINIYLFSRWFLLENDLEDYNAVWLIPGVGSFIVSITAISVGFIEIAWFFFAIGLIFWVFLSAALLFRYIFLPKHIDLLVPTYFLILVPLGLIPMIYQQLAGEELAHFTRIMYYFGLFWMIFMASMFKIFLRLKFSMGWWAYTFPFDTFASATIMFSDAAGITWLMRFGMLFLVFNTILVLGIFVRTLWEIFQGRILRPDPVPAPQQPA